MIKDLLYRMDKTLGNGLEQVARIHHRRRLRKLGWQHALAPSGGLWAGGDPPPRPDNRFEVLVDGASAFPEMIKELEAATSHIHIAGWYLSPDFRIERDATATTLSQLLARLAERVPVRVLVWAGIPVPGNLKTSRIDVRRQTAKLTEGSSVSLAKDPYERPLHCHHEKVIVIDDRIAFVGGIEPTDLGGDRFDSSDHPWRPSVGWHDATVRLEGPVVRDVVEHFRMRWKEVAGEELPASHPSKPAGPVTVQLIRTVPEKIYDALPTGDFRILETYQRALRSAREFVYLENQFLWSPIIVDILREKLADPPTEDFRVVVVLPSRPTTGADDTLGQLGTLLEADGDRGRFLACTLFARSGRESERVYVHAKIGIVDDKWLTIGSANLNSHSLFNDSEVNVVTCDQRLATSTRQQLWAEHLELPKEEVQGRATELVDSLWRPIAEEQLRRKTAGEPLTHRLVLLPHVSKRAKRLLGPVQSLFVDG